MRVRFSVEGRADLRAARRKKARRAGNVPPYQILFATEPTFDHITRRPALLRFGIFGGATGKLRGDTESENGKPLDILCGSHGGTDAVGFVGSKAATAAQFAGEGVFVDTG